MESSQKRIYKNPLSQTMINGKSVSDGILAAIEEEDLDKVGSKAYKQSDPFNQRVDSTGRPNAYYYKGYKAYSMPHMPQRHPSFGRCIETSETTKTLYDGGLNKRNRKSLSEYFQRMKTMLKCERQAIKEDDSAASDTQLKRIRKRDSWQRDCLGQTNKILQFVLMVLTILLILVTFFALATVSVPAKTVLVRVGNLLGEKSIELHNVTIANTNLEGIHIPDLQDMISNLFADEESLSSNSSQDEEHVVVMAKGEDSNVEANSIVVLKDAVNQPSEVEDAFMNWCENATCTESLRPLCSSMGRGLDKGQRDGVPIIPFPRDFCSAVRQLNKVGCMCDTDIKRIPGAERLSQSASLVATMCGFRNELQECD